MTDELKPCLAHPCDGVMKPNMYDASLTCSACQFQVADEAEYSALVAGRQAAIDAALTELVEYLDRHETTIYESVSDWAVEVVRSRIGTNPLAERAAEYARGIEFRVGQLAERDAMIAELESLLEEAYADADDVLRPRIAELERELSEEPHNIPTKYVQHGGVTFALHGSSSIRAYEELERELAEVRKDKRRLAAMMPLFQKARDAICYIPLTTAKLHGLDLTLADRMDTVGIKEKWEEYDAAMRQEGRHDHERRRFAGCREQPHLAECDEPDKPERRDVARHWENGRVDAETARQPAAEVRRTRRSDDR